MKLNTNRYSNNVKERTETNACQMYWQQEIVFYSRCALEIVGAKFRGICEKPIKQWVQRRCQPQCAACDVNRQAHFGKQTAMHSRVMATTQLPNYRMLIHYSGDRSESQTVSVVEFSFTMFGLITCSVCHSAVISATAQIKPWIAMRLLLWNFPSIFFNFIISFGCVSLSHTPNGLFQNAHVPCVAQLFRTDRHECKPVTHCYWAAGKWFFGLGANNALYCRVCTWIAMIDGAGLSCHSLCHGN